MDMAENNSILVFTYVKPLLMHNKYRYHIKVIARCHISSIHGCVNGLLVWSTVLMCRSSLLVFVLCINAH